MEPGRTRVFRGDDRGRRWELALHVLPAALRPYVLDCCGYREWTPAGLIRRELPIARIVVVLDLGLPVEVGGTVRADGFVAGLTDRCTVHRQGPYAEGIQLFLTPIGARSLLGRPMSDLTDQVVPMRELRCGDLVDRLRDDVAWGARFARVEAWLAERLRGGDPDRVVGWACDRVVAAGGGISIATLAREVGYSERHLGRRFHEQVGVAPKAYARLVRFERLAAHLRRHPADREWSGLAVRFGYFDQSHLVRDVRRFTDATPTGLDPLLAPFAPGVRA